MLYHQFSQFGRKLSNLAFLNLPKNLGVIMLRSETRKNQTQVWIKTRMLDLWWKFSWWSSLNYAWQQYGWGLFSRLKVLSPRLLFELQMKNMKMDSKSRPSFVTIGMSSTVFTHNRTIPWMNIYLVTLFLKCISQ